MSKAAISPGEGLLLLVLARTVLQKRDRNPLLDQLQRQVVAQLSVTASLVLRDQGLPTCRDECWYAKCIAGEPRACGASSEQNVNAVAALPAP